jgi:7,8-dihydroneopterin aldolase/epimerase/oxygenase
MYTVFVRGLEVYAYHGVPDAEQSIGHRYKVSVRMEVEGTADRTDQVADTVDYASVGQLIEKTVRDTQYRTLERLAHVALDNLFREHPHIRSAEITIEKPHPPAPIIAEATGVVLARNR